MKTKEKLVPELRFPEFTDEWEEKKLGEEFDFIKNYSYSRNNEGIGKYYHIHYGDIHSIYKSYIDKNTIIPSIVNDEEHIELSDGDLIIADASEDYDDLGKCVLLKESNGRKIIGGLHTFVLRSRGKVIPEYFLYYTKTDLYKKGMRRLGTGTSVYGINKRNYNSLDVYLPSLPEQQKIGNFFSKIDEKLELQRKRIAELKTYKKGMMQRIFNQELRFKDEKGNEYPEWEEKKLGDLGSFYRGRGLAKKDVIKNGKNKCILYGELFTEYSEVIDYVKSFTDKMPNNATLSKKGDLLFPTSTTADAVSLINPSAILEDNILIGGDISILRPNRKKINTIMLSYMINGVLREEIARFAEGITIFHIYSSNLKNIEVNIPSLPEQEKIANFLSAIDEKIELEEEKLKEYEEYKKGLMQRMFI